MEYDDDNPINSIISILSLYVCVYIYIYHYHYHMVDLDNLEYIR